MVIVNEIEDRAKKIRARFNEIGDTVSTARNALYHCQEIEKATTHLESIAEKLGIEDLEPSAIQRNILLYVDDYLTKLERHVEKRKTEGKL